MHQGSQDLDLKTNTFIYGLRFIKNDVWAEGEEEPTTLCSWALLSNRGLKRQNVAELLLTPSCKMHPQELKILQHGPRRAVWLAHQVSPLPGCEMRSSNLGSVHSLDPPNRDTDRRDTQHTAAQTAWRGGLPTLVLWPATGLLLQAGLAGLPRPCWEESGREVDSSVALTVPSRPADEAAARAAQPTATHLSLPPSPASGLDLISATHGSPRKSRQPSPSSEPFSTRQHFLSPCCTRMSSARTRVTSWSCWNKGLPFNTPGLDVFNDLMAHGQCSTRCSSLPWPSTAQPAPCVRSSRAGRRENRGNSNAFGQYAYTRVYTHVHTHR